MLHKVKQNKTSKQNTKTKEPNIELKIAWNLNITFIMGKTYKSTLNGCTKSIYRNQRHPKHPPHINTSTAHSRSLRGKHKSRRHCQHCCTYGAPSHASLQTLCSYAMRPPYPRSLAHLLTATTTTTSIVRCTLNNKLNSRPCDRPMRSNDALHN